MFIGRFPLCHAEWEELSGRRKGEKRRNTTFRGLVDNLAT